MTVLWAHTKKTTTNLLKDDVTVSNVPVVLFGSVYDVARSVKAMISLPIRCRSHGRKGTV